MKDIKEFLLEQLETEDHNITEAEESIKNADDFRSYAENKFKEVFGDKLDEKEMKEVIDSLIKEQEENNTDWGEIVGKLNKSFAK